MSNNTGYTFKAAANLEAAQYHIVRITNGVDQVNIGSLATHSSVIGVLQNRPKNVGDHASVDFSGVGKVYAGAAISSVGTFFTTNGSGRAVACLSGQMAVGRILETAAADGDVVQALYYPPFRLSGAI
jgi:hypothetical protein